MPSQRIITRADLCKAIQVSSDSLRKLISRGSIKEVRKGAIDLDDELNKSYILSYSVKKDLDAEKLLYSGPTTSTIGDIEVKHEEPSEEKPARRKKEQLTKDERKKKSYTELQTEKTRKEIEKLEIDAELKNLELEKKKAKVLPLDFILDWAAMNIKGVFGETINFGNMIIEQICSELDADTATKLEYKKKFKEGFNEVLKTGIKKQRPEAIKTAKEYSLTIKW